MEGISGYVVKSRQASLMPAVVSKKLRIDLSSRREQELFKWLLACLLFGKPIQEEIAERAYTRLVSAGLRNPNKVLDAGLDELVRLLDEARYVRNDFSTATKLLDVCWTLKQRYGNLARMIELATNAYPAAGVQTHRPHHCPDLHAEGSASLVWVPAGRFLAICDEALT